MNDVLLYTILFIAAFFAGLIDSIAGGGGLISLPVLLSVGVPPQIALGTNKLQGTLGSFTAALYYWRKKIIDLRDAKSGAVWTMIGAAAGAWAVQQIDAEILKDIIPALLFCIAVYTILTPSLGKAQKKAILHAEIFFFVFGLLLGFYDGFFGPGVGAFWAIAFVLLLGYDLQRATGYTKVMNFVSNIIALIVFAAGGSIWYSYGLVMGIGQMFGARIGALFAVKKGVAVIRPLYIIVVVATIAKLLYSRYW